MGASRQDLRRGSNRSVGGRETPCACGAGRKVEAAYVCDRRTRRAADLYGLPEAICGNREADHGNSAPMARNRRDLPARLSKEAHTVRAAQACGLTWHHSQSYSLIKKPGQIVRTIRPNCPDLLPRSEEHTSELQPPCNLVCRLLLAKTPPAPLAPGATAGPPRHRAPACSDEAV